MGELVGLRDGAGAGYLASGEGAGPGVLLIHESWRVLDPVTELCERFAAEGFTALAPDLEPEGASEDTAAHDLKRAAEDLSAAVDHLQDHPAVRGQGIGVVGFGTGGALALWLASIRPDRVRAVVPFYGMVPWDSTQPDWSATTAAVEGHYADNDDVAVPEAVAKLEQLLGDLGRDVRMFVYPGTSPGFFDHTRPEVYDEDAARQAWVRTLEFLRATLG